MDQRIKLGDEADMEMQGAIYAKEEMIHVRMDAHCIG